MFTPGEQFRGELAFYPASLPLRAVLMQRNAANADDPSLDWPEPMAGLDQALTAPLLAEPWAAARPILLPGGRIGFDGSGSPWWRPDDGATMLPVVGDVAGLIAGAALTRTAALWSGARLEILAARTPWGRLNHG